MDPRVDEYRFRVMGTDAHVIVTHGGDDAGPFAERQLRDLETRWSRFIPTSEVMRLNDCPGVPVIVSDATFDAIRMAVRAWEYTDGVFDPTVYDAMLAAGYDRDFQLLGGTVVPAQPAPGRTPGCRDIHFDDTVRAITLPPGVHIDLGGIGKGLAADIVARALIEHGAAGACVNLGGDLSAYGEPPSPAGWIIELTLPTPDALGGPTAIAIPNGACATSSSTTRHWIRTDGSAHHLIDPRTGTPVTSRFEAVTVLALDAWWAETCAKSILISGSLDLAARHANAGLAVGIDGSISCFGAFEAYLISPDPH